MSAIILQTELVLGTAYYLKAYELLNSAQHSIDILMYEWKWYENDPSCKMQRLNQAIVRAVRRGVKVRALVNDGKALTTLKAQGIDARTNFSSVVMHTKAVVVDGRHVLTGSHNFTENAMSSNIETSTLYTDEKIAKQLSDYMVSLWL